MGGMVDAKAVGADLTPSQQDETIADLAFFLDEFGSTHAVRAKLQEHESDVKRLVIQVRRLLHPRDENSQQQAEKVSGDYDSRGPISTGGAAEGEQVAGTMHDLDFFLKAFGSTRAVREKLESQRKEVLGLRRTVKLLEGHESTKLDCGESIEVECVIKKMGKGAQQREPPRADPVLTKTGNGNGKYAKGSESYGRTEKTLDGAMEPPIKNDLDDGLNLCLQPETRVAGDADFSSVLERANGVCVAAGASDFGGKGDSQQTASPDTLPGAGKTSMDTGWREETSSCVAAAKVRLPAEPQTKKPCCRYPGCTKNIKMNGLCCGHGGYHMCKAEGCDRRAATQQLCRLHGGGTKCKCDGCDKFAVSSGRGFCFRHAREQGAHIKAKCKVDGCKNQIQCQGRCKRHRHSPIEACTRELATFDRKMTTQRQVVDHDKEISGQLQTIDVDPSIRHERRVCKEPGCENKAKAGGRTGYCFRHGGGTKCTQPGCTRQRKLRGLCAAHGGFRDCKVASCKKHEYTGGYCWQHHHDIHVDSESLG